MMLGLILLPRQSWRYDDNIIITTDDNAPYNASIQASTARRQTQAAREAAKTSKDRYIYKQRNE